MGYYNGTRGALRFIADITDDYDSANSVEGLQFLIQEIREEVIRALAERKNYSVQCSRIK